MARKTRKQSVMGNATPHECETIERWCRLTGRTPGASPEAGNVKTIKHGILASRFMGEDERPLFEELIARFREEFTLNNSVDFIQLELACVYMLQLARAILAENWETARTIDAMMRRHLGDLKTTKKSREGEKAVASQVSPAEWSAQLLERIRARQEAEKAAAPGETPESLPRTPDAVVDGEA